MSARRFLRRLTTGLLFIAAVSTAGLLLARSAPGDYSDTLRAARLDDATIARERARLYLDRSLPELSRIWLTGLGRLDLGQSYRFSRPVRDLLVERTPRTLTLVVTGLALAVALAIVWGAFLVRAPRSLQIVGRAITGAGMSVPGVVVLFVLLLFASRFGVIEAAGAAIVMPLAGILALVIPSASAVATIHAQALAEALSEPWATAALARGVPASRLVWYSALRPAATRIVSVFPLISANVLSMSLLVEVITGWAGLGRLTLDALVARDVFLVAGCTAALCAMMVVLTAIADAASMLLDPRIDLQVSS